MDSPEEWRWIWLAAAVLFAVGELATPGTFFLFFFALGAAVATLLAFAGVSLTVEWIAFLAVSIGALAALRPLTRRFDAAGDDRGVGAQRLVGQTGTVLREIPGAGELGLVRVDREEWRAESLDGSPIAPGVAVKVADIQGTRVIVSPVGQITSPSEGADL
jgi:membrane protein implicated in regulation of membrane protease activity